MTRDQLIETMRRRIESSKKMVAEFAHKLEGDPLYEMSWGADALRHMAEVSVISPHLHALESGVEVKKLRDQLKGELLQAARSPERSTSQMHNLAAQAGNTVKVELFDQFETVREDRS